MSTAIGTVVLPVKKWDPRSSGAGTITYIDLSSVDRDIKVIAEPSLVNASDAPSRARQLVLSGDVLVSTVRPNLNAVAVVPPELDGATASTGFAVLRPKAGQLSNRYLFHWVKSPGFVADMVRQATGASYPAVSDKIIKASRIPLPPIEEQRRIAAVLDAADALRSKRREALAKLDTLTQAIFIDMFGDPIANDRAWSLGALESVCERIQIGPFGSKLHQSDYVSGGIPLVNPMHIVDGAIVNDDDQSVAPEKCGELQSYLLEVDDVVMGRRGEMGRVAIVSAREAGYVCGSGSLFMRPDPKRVRPAYLAAVLSSPQGRRRLEQSAQGVTMPNLNASIVQSFRLAIPPIEQQTNFEVAVASHRRVEHSAREHMNVLDDLFASVQQRAFRGEL